jgi:ABC-type nitrate/sulfonate/bicarbonate transport system permease component
MALIDYIQQLFGGKNFTRFFLSCWWSAFAMWAIWYLLTHELSGSMKEFGNTILGFLMGTVVGTVVNFYFGSSQSSSDKDDVIKDAKHVSQ